MEERIQVIGAINRNDRSYEYTLLEALSSHHFFGQSFNDYLEKCIHYQPHPASKWMGIFMDFYKYRSLLDIYDKLDIFKDYYNIEFIWG